MRCADHNATQMSTPATASAAATLAAPPAPYRIPIHLLRPRDDAAARAVAPDFHVCLIDQLLTAEQRAERRRLQGQAQPAQPPTSGAVCAVTSLAADRPAHDRLPVTIAITTANDDAAATASISAACAPVGVQLVTLLQPSDSAAWHAARDAQQALEPHARTTVRLESVPLAHASRCPCRAPLTPESDNSVAAASACAASEAAAASPVSAAPSSAVPNQLRLAVVVVPSLYSVRHCSRCAPDLAPDVSPCTRVLATRRPAMMRAFPGCWVFPGGACDPTDPSLEHTGAREVQEETGMIVEPDQMQLVALWEAVYPVIRPSSLGAHERFEPKARYLITMFTAPVHMPVDSAAAADACSTPADGSVASSFSPAALAARSPTCVGCSVPLRLCSTEVDAGVWLSGLEFDALRRHASYFHTDNEAELQTQHKQHAHTHAQQQSSQRCQADTDECSCAELNAMVTPAYAQQHAKHTRLKSDASSDATASPAVVDSAAASAGSPAVPFVSAFVPCCALYGLYPNRSGSGMAEGHLVALEEMRARGLF